MTKRAGHHRESLRRLGLLLALFSSALAAQETAKPSYVAWDSVSISSVSGDTMLQGLAIRECWTTGSDAAWA